MTALLDPASADLTLMQDRQVAVLGYGQVAAAHALNLRDSGIDVRVGLEPDSRAAGRAEVEGLLVVPPGEAVAQADVVVVPAGESPDLASLQRLLAGLEPEDLVLVTDGSAVRFDGLAVPAGVDLVMLRTVGGGSRMRSEFLDGRGAPCLVAVHTDATGLAWPVLTAYAQATGALRSGAIVTTVDHDAHAARFAEVAVHDSVDRLVEGAFDVLSDAGVEPEVAYLAILHGLRERIERVYAEGYVALHAPDSETGRGAGQVDPGLSDRLGRAWTQVTTGSAGRPEAVGAGQQEDLPPSRREAARAAHPLQQVGRRVRDLMSWAR